MKNFRPIATALTLFCTSQFTSAQELHVNPRWKECSFQLDQSLTQQAWHQFAKEAALVTYFRPLTDAKPMGTGHFEISVLRWATAIDDTKAAWNDTFVHPDSSHWLVEGPRLAFPGLTARVGITNKLDVAIYFTKSPGANYGFLGGQAQYNLINKSEQKWALATRLSFISMYGPQDLKLNVYSADLLVSKEFKLYWDWASVSPYAGISTYLSHSRETTDRVDLKHENILSGLGMVGAVVKISTVRIGMEYGFAKVNTVSVKVGVAF